MTAPTVSPSSVTKRAPLETERTAIGEQYLVGGVRPVTVKDRLERMAMLPISPKRPCVQKPCNHGLFDEDARNQLDLF